jgi:hypothetical protein
MLLFPGLQSFSGEGEGIREHTMWSSQDLTLNKHTQGHNPVIFLAARKRHALRQLCNFFVTSLSSIECKDQLNSAQNDSVESFNMGATATRWRFASNAEIGRHDDAVLSLGMCLEPVLARTMLNLTLPKRRCQYIK